MMLSSVDLPHPEAPTMAGEVRVRDLDRHVVERLHFAAPRLERHRTLRPAMELIARPAPRSGNRTR